MILMESGLMSSSAVVLGKTPASKEALLQDIQAAYLDNLVTSGLERGEKLKGEFAGVGPCGEVVQKVLREASCRRSSSPRSPSLHPLINRHPIKRRLQPEEVK